jgi:hypothetical protein
LRSPAAANKIWARVDRKVTDLAPVITLLNPKLVGFVSKRVEGCKHTPQAVPVGARMGPPGA